MTKKAFLTALSSAVYIYVIEMNILINKLHLVPFL